MGHPFILLGRKYLFFCPNLSNWIREDYIEDQHLDFSPLRCLSNHDKVKVEDFTVPRMLSCIRNKLKTLLSIGETVIKYSKFGKTMVKV